MVKVAIFGVKRASDETFCPIVVPTGAVVRCLSAN